MGEEGSQLTTVNKEINQETKTLGGGEVGEASDGGREGGGALHTVRTPAILI